MPTPPKGPRLGGSPAHERLILSNLAQSLFEHGKITTTLTKAKRLRPVAEKLITAAKRNTLHTRRHVLKTISDKDVVHKLFAEIGPSFATRDGGYTRITKTLPRKGDNAPMAVIELIGEETVSSAASRVARTAASRKKSPKAQPAQPAASEAPAAADTAEAAAATDVETAEDSAVAADTGETAEAADTAEVEESASTEDAPYGEGSHAPLDDGSEPDGFPIKGNEDSKLYHVPGSSHYAQTAAEVWFATAEAAEAAGFSLPPSQQPDGSEDAAEDVAENAADEAGDEEK